MTDRELMQMAYKAVTHGAILSNDKDMVRYWNPLINDGDALRLAVKFLFEIDMGRGCIAIRHSTGIKILEAFNHDPYAATRRAIVRAAAEIGKGMT